MTPTAEKFLALLEIISRLRAPDGCPWDQKQTPQTFKQYLVEETHELLEAINDDSPSHICEELGDLLFQVIFLNNLYQEKNLFTLSDVIDSICAKMIRRHPHVFGSETIDSEQELRQQWQAIKNQENEQKEKPRHLLDSIPKSLPALRRAQRVADRVAREGFDWPDISGALSKVSEEFQELQDAFARGAREQIREEFGDLLFALAVVARKADIDGEDALHEATGKFTTRFLMLEKNIAGQGKQLIDLPPRGAPGGLATDQKRAGTIVIVHSEHKIPSCPRIVTVQLCRRCTKEACSPYIWYADQADDKADAVLLNGYEPSPENN